MLDKLSEIQDYNENLAHLHKDVLHNVDGRVAFARFKSDDQVTQITKNSAQNIVVIAEINGQMIGPDGELRRGVAIIFASKAAAKGNRQEAIDAANDKSEEIMLDFIAKYRYDQDNECDLAFDLENISWNDIEGPWLQNYYGWMLFLPFKGWLPEYDQDKWNEE